MTSTAQSTGTYRTQDVWNAFDNINTVPTEVNAKKDGSFDVRFGSSKYTLSNKLFIMKNMLPGCTESTKVVKNIDIKDLSPFLIYVSGMDHEHFDKLEIYQKRVQDFNKVVQADIAGQQSIVLKYKRCLQIIIVIVAIAALITFKD